MWMLAFVVGMLDKETLYSTFLTRLRQGAHKNSATCAQWRMFKAPPSTLLVEDSGNISRETEEGATPPG